jgi:hypothetical protein
MFKLIRFQYAFISNPFDTDHQDSPRLAQTLLQWDFAILLESVQQRSETVLFFLYLKGGSGSSCQQVTLVSIYLP